MHMDKKLIVLPILVTIALSITGFGVAHWTDMIYINGTINMANMTLAFTTQEPPFIYEVPEPKGKDVGWTEGYYDKLFQDTHTGKWGYKEFIIIIHNAYPSYEVHCVFVVENVGILPIHIYGYEITDPSGTLTWDLLKGALVDANGNEIINVRIVDLISRQIEPEDNPLTPEVDNKAKAEIDLHIKQDALECHTYYFKVGILYEQYEN